MSLPAHQLRSLLPHLHPARSSCRLLAALLVVSLATPIHAALNVAIIDYQDSWSGTKGLGQLLTDLGQSYTDLTSQVQSGQAINLAGYDTFIVGSFCTQTASIRNAIINAATHLNAFVNGGGTVIMLTQADQNISHESWVQAPAVIVRADPDFGTVYRVQPGHQLFSTPEAISDANIQGWQYLGAGGTWPTSWESFSTFQHVGVLAGDDPSDVNLGTIIETGWGTGRALFLALAPDKARNIGNATAKAQAPRLMRNLLRYAQDVKAGTVPPVVIYQGGGWPGPIAGRVFHDVNENGVWDAGDTGIAGVGVSDTIDLVLTDPDGTYSLPNTAGSARLVYISLPSGYSKHSRWYQHISAASPPAHFDFPLTPADESGPFTFVQVSDTHVGGSGNRQLLTEGLAQIAALKERPAFIMPTGDLVNVGSSLSQYDDYVAALATSVIPVFSVFGNHDANNGGSGNYRKYLGPDYYSFNYGDCHFLIVNSVHKTPQQAAWIAKDLQLLRGSKRLFIFQHYSPSEQEHNQFASYGATAVFTGHWHSQHTVRVGNTLSYNTANMLFGGIDCSPAGFKIIRVEADSISTKMRWMANGKRLQIVTPSDAVLVPRDDVQIIVNAYESSALITSVTYEVKKSGVTVAQGSLSPEGDWSWKGLVPAVKVPRGAYTLEVTATNDRDETFTANTTFMVMGLGAPRISPADEWPQFGGGPQRGGATPTTLEPPLGAVWCRNTGGTLDFASPVLKDQTVYIGVKDRNDFQRNGVMALDATDGAQDWFTPTPAAVSHSVAVDAHRVYACSHGGILHALSRTDGSTIWTAILGSAVQRFQYSSPVLIDNQVFAGTYGYFGRFDAATGAKVWNQTYGADWISSNASPAVKDDIVVVPANWASNSLRGVSRATGATLWQYNVRGLHGSPVIAGDRVVFTDYDGKLHCIQLATGANIWTKDLGGGRSASTPAIAHGIVVAGGVGSIRGFRLDNGNQIWSVPIGTSALKMAPYNNGYGALVGSATIAGHTAYVPCGDGKLYALALETGEVRWSMNFGTPIISAPCISGNMLYLSAYDGNVYALTTRDAYALGPDFDLDDDVDLTDFAYMQLCLTGPGSVLPGCEDANLNSDGMVDQLDLVLFIGCISGANIAFDPLCLDGH